MSIACTHVPVAGAYICMPHASACVAGICLPKEGIYVCNRWASICGLDMCVLARRICVCVTLTYVRTRVAVFLGFNLLFVIFLC